MDLFDSKRQERLEAARKASTASKEADYEGLGETEEYIDLLPILKNLYINPETFLKPIKSVKIDYHEGREEEIKIVAGNEQ